MKRTTILSITSVLFTFIFFIGYVLYYSHPTGKKTDKISEVLQNKDSVVLPATKYVYIQYCKDISKEVVKNNLISSIEFIPSSHGSKLEASQQVLNNIKTAVNGDTLQLTLDLNDKDFWTNSSSKARNNKKKAALLTIALDKKVKHVSDSKNLYGNHIDFYFKGFHLPEFEISMKNHVFLTRCTIGRLEISLATSLTCKEFKAQVLSIVDGPKQKTHIYNLNNAQVDTLDVKAHQYMKLAKNKNIKHIRWETMNDNKAAVNVTLCNNQTVEEVHHVSTHE